MRKLLRVILRASRTKTFWIEFFWHENSNRRHCYKLEARLDLLQDRRRRNEKNGSKMNGDAENQKSS